MYKIMYTDMVSENFYCFTQSDVIPLNGDIVCLPGESSGRVYLIEHVYTKNRDEFVVLDFVKIFLEWIA